MSEWAELLGELSDAQVDQVFRVGTELNLPSGTLLVEENEAVEAIYFLIHGLFEVRLRALPSAPLATLGPGEIVGDMSFLDELPASATVIATESAQVVRLPHQGLKSHIKSHPEFGAHFYRVLGGVLSRRLRNTMGRLAATPVPDDQRAPAWKRASEAIDGFKSKLLKVDKLAIKGKGQVSTEVIDGLKREFAGFTRLLGEILGTEPNELVATEIGRLVQREILPYLLMTQVAERMYSKPRGYAGDFMTIELMYQNLGGGSGRLGPILDRCFLEDRAAKAVRHRRHLMAEEIGRTVEGKNGTAQILSIACGPAREVFDAFAALTDKHRLHATLLDVDSEAIELVSRIQAELGLAEHLTLIRENALYVALGRKKLKLPPLDLVYSVGMTDYLSDKLTIKVLDFAYDALAPGGRAIFGNFHPRNSSRAMMDHVLEWQLIHRSEDDMNRLFAASKFGGPCTRITFEEEGIDLFAECIKR